VKGTKTALKQLQTLHSPLDFRKMMKKSFAIALFLMVLVATGCSGTKKPVDSPNAGRTLAYEEGVPNFDMEAIPTWREDSAGIDLYVGLPYRSLIFLRTGNMFDGKYEAVVRIMDDKGKATIKEESFNDTISITDYEKTQSIEAISVQKRFKVAPGTYVVEVAITDVNSKKEAIRRQRLTLNDLASGNISLSRILVEGRSDITGFRPIVAYHTGSDVDSLRAVVELYNADAAPEVQTVMILRALPTDRNPAQPPYWFTPSLGSLSQQGVFYNRGDTLQVTRRAIRNVSSEAVIEFNLPKLKPGTYRINIAVTAPQKGNSAQPTLLLKEQRDLSIKSPGFPRIETLQHMVEPLAYIAYKREMQEILKATSVEELKTRFDAFWGEKMPSRQSGLNTIKEFYNRVEQANLYFSTHKEGWKTDPGMVYIVMGAPQSVDEQFDAEIWRYSYSNRDPLSTFVFQKIRPSEGDFINYILIRNPYFEQEWLRQIERWRTGQVF